MTYAIAVNAISTCSADTAPSADAPPSVGSRGGNHSPVNHRRGTSSEESSTTRFAACS
jgi:hypothetical protein